MALQNITLISDPKVLSIPIKETNEPLVDLLKEKSKIRCDNSQKNLTSVTPDFSKARREVFKKLLHAQDSLPESIYLFIKEAFRPIEYQKKIFNHYKNKLRKQFSYLDEEKLYIEASKFIAPPDIIPPHSTGGAVDLILVNENNLPLEMGGFPDNNSSYNETCLTYSENISKKAKDNRKILITVMENAGFVNYPYEWWHFSFGDRYWAYLSEEPFARCGGGK